MTQPAFHDQEVHVREHPVPGNARLFHLTLSDGTLLAISTDADTTDRALAVVPPTADEAVTSVHLSSAEATTLSADRCVEVQPPGGDQLQHRDRGEQLADQGDVEAHVERVRYTPAR